MKQFADTYPAIKKSLPLTIGVDKLLTAQHPEFPAKLVRSALFHYTKTATYLRNLVKSEHRYNLDGTPASEISPEQKSFAQQQLKQIKDNQAKAKQAAEQAKQDAEKAVKLAELVAKFGKN